MAGGQLVPVSPEQAWCLLVVGLLVTYGVAFGSLAWQVDGLIGSTGISPVGPRLYHFQKNYCRGSWWRSMLRWPTVLWLFVGMGSRWGPNRWALVERCRAPYLLCLAGVVVSCSGLVSILVMPTSGRQVFTPAVHLGLNFFLYLSLAEAAELRYPWDCLLLEAGSLAMLLPHVGVSVFPPLYQNNSMEPRIPALVRPPDAVVAWAFRFLLFRLMIGFGRTKFAGTDHRKDRAYIRDFVVAQPIPTRLGWLAHHAPLPVHVLLLVGMFVVEIIVPFFFFVRGWPRQVAALATVGLQVGIQATGNYGHFNVLTSVLCLCLLDDRSSLWGDEGGFPLLGCQTSNNTSLAPGAVPCWLQPLEWVRAAALAFLFLGGLVHFPWSSGLTFSWTFLPGILRAEADPRLRWLGRLLVAPFRAVAPFRILHGYGVFPPHAFPGVKVVAVVEGQGCRGDWRQYPWRCMIHDPFKPPPFVAPHHPRLDYQSFYDARGMSSADFMAGLFRCNVPSEMTHITVWHRLALRLLAPRGRRCACQDASAEAQSEYLVRKSSSLCFRLRVCFAPCWGRRMRQHQMLGSHMHSQHHNSRHLRETRSHAAGEEVFSSYAASLFAADPFLYERPVRIRVRLFLYEPTPLWSTRGGWATTGKAAWWHCRPLGISLLPPTCREQVVWRHWLPHPRSSHPDMVYWRGCAGVSDEIACSVAGLLRGGGAEAEPSPGMRVGDDSNRSDGNTSHQGADDDFFFSDMAPIDELDVFESMWMSVPRNLSCVDSTVSADDLEWFWQHVAAEGRWRLFGTRRPHMMEPLGQDGRPRWSRVEQAASQVRSELYRGHVASRPTPDGAIPGCLSRHSGAAGIVREEVAVGGVCAWLPGRLDSLERGERVLSHLRVVLSAALEPWLWNAPGTASDHLTGSADPANAAINPGTPGAPSSELMLRRRRLTPSDKPVCASYFGLSLVAHAVILEGREAYAQALANPRSCAERLFPGYCEDWAPLSSAAGGGAGVSRQEAKRGADEGVLGGQQGRDEWSWSACTSGSGEEKAGGGPIGFDPAAGLMLWAVFWLPELRLRAAQLRVSRRCTDPHGLCRAVPAGGFLELLDVLAVHFTGSTTGSQGDTERIPRFTHDPASLRWAEATSRPAATRGGHYFSTSSGTTSTRDDGPAGAEGSRVQVRGDRDWRREAHEQQKERRRRHQAVRWSAGNDSSKCQTNPEDAGLPAPTGQRGKPPSRIHPASKPWPSRRRLPRARRQEPP